MLTVGRSHSTLLMDLVEAIRKDDRVYIQEALDNGLDLSAFIGIGHPPLCKAASLGRDKVCEMLLQAGADPNQAGAGQSRPIHLAVVNAHPKVVRMLAKRGANLEATNALGFTALGTAIFHKLPRMVSILIEFGASVNGANDNAWPPLRQAASLTGKKAAEIVKQLIDAGADVHWNDDAILIAACADSDVNIVEQLLNAGCNCNAVNAVGETALMYAAFEGKDAIVQTLLQWGVDTETIAPISHPDWPKLTALDIATQGKKRKVVKLLERAV